MRTRPALLTVVTFLALIALGTVALYAFGLRPEQGRRFVTAIFTATSAVCVTGLTVVDVQTELPPTGQVLVLVLLQVGGLGVLTISNWVLLTLRRRLHMGGAMHTRETYGGMPQLGPGELLASIILFTAVTEAVGALLLFARFAADAPPAQAAWQAVFHSVSAFCNAGFSLFSSSLVPYRGDVYVNVVMMGLIFAGGIGFVAARDIGEAMRTRLRGRRRRLTFHTRVVLWTSLVLIVVGAALFWIFEWGNAAGRSGAGEGLLEAFFLSVTARTAGFNTVETGHLTNMTLLVLMLLMMIGASPGSTGGGVKTTSMAIIWARTRSHILNRHDTEMLGRSVPRDVAAKAMAILMIYLVVAFLAMVGLQATEYGEVPHDETRGTFLEHAFEVISALSTVGLSTGITSRFSDGGLGILMACMLVGRVGPLVLASSVIGERRRLAYDLPEGDVMVG